MPHKHAIVREDVARVVHDAANLSPLRDQSILVTGGTGFLGTWLTEILAHLNDAHGFKVRINLIATRPAEFGERVPHLARRADVKLIARDVANLVELPAEIQYLIHAAASPDNRLHASDPLRVIRTIVAGTQAVAECAARLSGLKRMLNVSSGLVYGAKPVGAEAVSENAFGGIDSASLVNVYAEAKRMAETISTAYRGQHRLPMVTARPFSFLGPYQPLDRPWAINNFIRDTLQGGPVRIQGDGQTVRGYMYGADFAWWILNILVRAEVGKAYNVGSSSGINLLDLAHKVAGLMPTQPRISTGLFGEGTPRTSFIPDTSSASRDFGLKQTFDLSEALQRTVEWHMAA
jgi:nucleoside-diphosphate-sugar epimerase